MKKTVLFMLIFASLFCFAQQNKDNFVVQNANEYLLSKYQDHDIVILGESHWQNAQLSFLKKSIPLLYKNGIRCFAFEFLAFTAQEKINRLIAADKFSKTLRDSIIADKPLFFIKEYMDILYVFWKLNQSGKEKVKVLSLGVPVKFPLSIDNDSVMADIVLKNYSQTKDKMLIYCGANHGFTKFFICRGKGGEDIVRMGNIIYQKFPDKITNIYLFPMIYEDENSQTYFLSYKDKNRKSFFGMDLKNSPISKNTSGAHYLQKCDGYSLGNIYDGAIFINQEIKLCQPLQKFPEEYKKMVAEMRHILKKTKITYISE